MNNRFSVDREPRWIAYKLLTTDGQEYSDSDWTDLTIQDWERAAMDSMDITEISAWECPELND